MAAIKQKLQICSITITRAYNKTSLFYYSFFLLFIAVVRTA